MPESTLPYDYELEEKSSGMTAVAASPRTWSSAAHWPDTADPEHVKVHGTTQGWTDEQLVCALVWLTICGGDCIADTRMLESDDGLCRSLMEFGGYALTRSRAALWNGGGARNGAELCLPKPRS